MGVKRRSILFAGGGTGGHIYPNVAVAEALGRAGFEGGPGGPGGVHFLVSGRAVDRKIMEAQGVAYTISPARGWSWGAGVWVGALRAVVQAFGLVRRLGVGVVVVTGGFVGGCAAVGAWLGGARVVIVNVDAAAGRGHRWVRWLATKVFSVSGGIEGAQRIGVPLRADAVWAGDAGSARVALGLVRDRPVLLVVGGSQGAGSINAMMVELLGRGSVREALRGWQVLHVVGGGGDPQNMEQAYRLAGVSAVVMRYCDRMGCAWGAADVAVSRGGALSVAEAQANGTPTIFLPYPHHRDSHQARNAQGAVAAGGALILEDHSDAVLNADRVSGVLTDLLCDPAERGTMRAAMKGSFETGGEDRVAGWLVGQIGTAEGLGPG